MLDPSKLHGYQKTAIIRQIKYLCSMLWLDMGLGKTIITLTTLDHRMRAGQVKKTLLFAPLKVIHTGWEKEARLWHHTKHLRFQIIHGTVEEKELQFSKDADVYLTNYENMSWMAKILQTRFIDEDEHLPFQMVVYDEVTKLKGHNTKRLIGGTRVVDEGKKTQHKVKVHGWRSVLGSFKYRTGLTGTPAPNGYSDLFGQYLAVDGGDRLGKNITTFRNHFLTRNYNGYGYTATGSGILQIQENIKDITIEMSAKDYLKLPDLLINDIIIPFSPRAKKKYDALEKEFFVELDSNEDIEVFNRASLSNKLLQFCNGSPYLAPDEPDWYPLHDLKLLALEGVLEEAGGNPVLCSYTFKADAERIMKKFRRFAPINLTAVAPRKLKSTLKDIIDGKYRLIVGHPASIGHGIDGLQHICHIMVWFGLNWNLELYSQLIARIRRQGQEKSVIVHRILMADSMDEVVRESLLEKDDNQVGLRRAIRVYRMRKELNFW